MKLTDFALVFAVIFLPVIIIIYVNISFVVKSEKNEMYYKNIINSATADAAMAMKQVENPNIDYGYSGIIDKKVSINAEEAVNTFYNSLANNFGISEDEKSIEKLKMYIPVIAIIDYDGIYIHSIEEDSSGNLVFVTKPKVRYTYTYVLYNDGTIINTMETNYISSGQLLSDCIYEITFTMDDYVYLNIYNFYTKELIRTTGFYLTDVDNNTDLVYTDKLVSEEEKLLKQEIVAHLSGIRKNLIASLGMKHISYAINKHNDYAKLTGVKYNFTFAVESDESWYETMDGIGIITVIQGISLGNRYLNYKAYSASDLTESKKYYVSMTLDDDYSLDRYYLNYNLYHSSERCFIYEYYKTKVEALVRPLYYLNKADAATQGYYPCPICKP